MTMTSFPWDQKQTAAVPWEQGKSTPQHPSNQFNNQYPNQYTNQFSNQYSNQYSTNPYATPQHQNTPSWNQSQPSSNSYSPYSQPNSYTQQYNQPSHPQYPSSEKQTSYNWQSAEPPRNPYESESRYNPFDTKKAGFPWEKSSQQTQPPAFQFGTKEGSSYSSILKEQQDKTLAIIQQQKTLASGTPGKSTASATGTASGIPGKSSSAAGGTYSSFYSEGKKAQFPWEKKKDAEEDSLESRMRDLLKQPTPDAPTIEIESKKDKAKSPKKEDPKPAEEQAKSPKSSKKSVAPKSPKQPRAKSKTPIKSVSQSEKLETADSEIKIKVKKAQSKAIPDETNAESSPTDLKEPNPPPSSPKPSEKAAPVTGASPKTKLFRSSSMSRLTKERVKSAPPAVSDVPKHINRKSELLAKKYLSAYAKPRIPPKKEIEKKDEDKPS